MKFYFFTVFVFLSTAYAALTKVPYSGLNLTGSIVSSDISASAGIPFSKLQSVASGTVLIGNASNVASATTLSGDASLSPTGVLSLATTGVTSGTYINAQIDAKGRVTSASNTITQDISFGAVTVDVSATTFNGGAFNNAIFNAASIANPTIFRARDNKFYLQDNSDPTKELYFELSGLSAGVSRTMAVPNFSSFTPATIDNAQTWTAVPNMNAGLTASGTISANNNVVMANGKGIDFSANSNAVSATSEVLSDYEAGTCALTIEGGSTSGTATYNLRSCSYTKIGRRVGVDAYVNWSGHTGTGSLNIGGLPFVSTNTTNYRSGCAIGYADSISQSASTTLAATIGQAVSHISLYQVPVSGTTTSIGTDNSNNNLIMLHCDYMTD